MNKTIDYNLLKVFLTLFVVLGHITLLYNNNFFDFLEPNKITGFITGAIYSFHMPFFIFISGCIYGICLKSGKYANYASMLKNKSKRLLLPYIFIALFFLAPVLCLTGTKYHYADYLLNGVLLGKAPHHLWFLLSLFTMFLLIRIIEKFLSLRSRIVCVVMIVLLSFFNSQIRIVYFQVEMTLHYFIYFYIGYLFEYENIRQ
jgi:fucose 4-O-acetylase-like acetyltransferase